MAGRIAVLGGGVAGVVLARELARRGAAVDVIEREPRLGGLHRSVVVDGSVFDIGAFVFDDHHQVLAGFPFLLDVFPRVPWSSISIRPSGNVDRFPISIAGYAREVGVAGLASSLAALLWAKLRYFRRDSVPAYAKYYMGAEVYERSGLKHYIERLYGIPDDEVGLEFAAQRLPDLPRIALGRTALRVLRGLPRRLVGGAAGHPLARVRPPGGFDVVYGMIHDSLEKSGVRVRLGRDVRAVRRAAGRFEVVCDDGVEVFDRVVSTIPIPAAQRLVGLPPAMTIDTVGLYSMFYAGVLRHEAPMQHNFTLEGRWKRLIAFSKLYGARDGEDFWTVEVTTRDTSAAELEELRRDFEEHAGRHGLFAGTPRFLGGHLTAHAYPVFHRGDAERVDAERQRLRATGLELVGRQGTFEYLSSDATAKKAAEAAARIAAGGPQGQG